MKLRQRNRVYISNARESQKSINTEYLSLTNLVNGKLSCINTTVLKKKKGDAVI